MKKLFIILLSVICLSGCTKMPKENPLVTMDIEDFGTIEIELYPKVAFNTVANFVNLVEEGFYDGNNFHRFAPGFVLQGGDPTATGTGGPGYTIKGEFGLNGYTNNLTHTKGIVSMARAKDYNSAGSQFFIVLTDNYTTTLDGKYAAFGKVTKGWDILEKIQNTEFSYSDEENGILEKPISIEKATVETYGYTYNAQKITDK